MIVMSPDEFDTEPVNNLMHFVKTWLIAMLSVCLVVYPYIWYKKMQTREAERFIAGYNGGEPGKDPWGTPYLVVKDDTKDGLVVKITSAGRDKDFGTEDDIEGGYRRSVTVTVIER